jgi:hypothetical protein
MECGDNPLAFACLTSVDLGNLLPSLTEDDDGSEPVRGSRRGLPLLTPNKTVDLLPRQAGLTGGGSRAFVCRTSTGAQFTITSHPYPNGNDGAYLLSVNPNAGRMYDVAHPGVCADPSITPNGLIIPGERTVVSKSCPSQLLRGTRSLPLPFV